MPAEDTVAGSSVMLTAETFKAVKKMKVQRPTKFISGH